MLTFHASIHGDSSNNDSSNSDSSNNGGALHITFDDATAALQKLDRMFIEPDGAFVWTGADADGQRWQVDGNLIDRGEALAYVELHGCCPEAEFDRLLTILAWPSSALSFHLPQSGRLLDEVEFRRLAAMDRGAV